MIKREKPFKLNCSEFDMRVAMYLCGECDKKSLFRNRKQKTKMFHCELFEFSFFLFSLISNTMFYSKNIYILFYKYCFRFLEMRVHFREIPVNILIKWYKTKERKKTLEKIKMI